MFRATPDAGSPSFLAHRLAEHVAYALWDAPPDQVLLDALLAVPEAQLVQALGSQVTRLTANERAAVVVTRFVAQWLEVDTDARRSDPAFATTPAFLELLAFVSNHLKSSTPITELIAGPTGFVHPSNQAVYGVQLPTGEGTEVAAVAWPIQSARRGVIGQELIASSTRHPDLSRRQIFRGVLVREALLCQTLPPVPPGVVDLAGEVEDRTTDVRCAGCHSMLDPVGVAFAALDPDNTLPAQPVTLIQHAELAGTYSDLPAMLTAISTSRAFAECFSRQWLAFFLERDAARIDEPWVKSLADSVQAGAGFDALLAATLEELVLRARNTVPACGL